MNIFGHFCQFVFNIKTTQTTYVLMKNLSKSVKICGQLDS